MKGDRGAHTGAWVGHFARVFRTRRGLEISTGTSPRRAALTRQRRAKRWSCMNSCGRQDSCATVMGFADHKAQREPETAGEAG